jgi:hypothetical protein
MMGRGRNWEVEYTNEFNDWWLTLDEEQQEAVTGRVVLLQRRGPALGRPSVDTVNNSRHANMKELRCSMHGVLRVLFAFDPTSSAILLMGGDKSNSDPSSPVWNDWYKTFIPLADDLYDEHLRILRQEKGE